MYIYYINELRRPGCDAGPPWSQLGCPQYAMPTSERSMRSTRIRLVSAWIASAAASSVCCALGVAVGARAFLDTTTGRV